MNLVSVPYILTGALIIGMAGVLGIAMHHVLNRKKAYRNGSVSRKLRLRAALCSMLLLTSLAAGAAETNVQIGDFFYTLNSADKTAILAQPTSPYTVAEVTIPESVTDESGITYTVTVIGNGAFSGSTALTSISIPPTITTIEKSAFRGCRNLASLRVEPGEQPLTFTDEVFEEGFIKEPSDFVPMYCYIGRELYTTSLAYFLRYTNVQKCEIEHIKTLTNKYFKDAKNLSELILHEGLEILDNSSIYNCPSIRNLVIPKGVTHINHGNFDQCQGLESVSLPSTVVQIPKFWESALLTEIKVHADTPPVVIYKTGTKADPYPTDTSAKGVVHVHASALEAYQASGWGKDERYVLQGDLSEEGDLTKTVTIAAAGPGTLALTEIDGTAAQDFPVATEGEQTLTLLATSENLTFMAQPDASCEAGTISLTDKDGNLLPSTITIAGASVKIQAKLETEMRLNADFHAKSEATLHVVMPGGKSGPLTLHIPAGAPYSLQYTSTPGYHLSIVMLDEEELAFTALEQQPSTQTEETPETGSVISYQIEIPAFEGERTLRMAEEEGDIQTGVEDGQGGGSAEDASGISPRLLYKEGRACIAGLNPGETVSIYSPEGELVQTLKAGSGLCFMPMHITGLHLITVAGRTFKAML